MSFQLVGRLRRLLSRQNAEYLNIILELLTSGKGPAYEVFWIEFRKQQGVSREAPQAAWVALRELQSIVKEYLR